MREDYIAHFGVKGMKWGIRKKRETSGRKRSKKQNNDSRVQRILRSRKTKIAVGAAAVVGASFAAYFIHKKVGALRVQRRQDMSAFFDFVTSPPTNAPVSESVRRGARQVVGRSAAAAAESAASTAASEASKSIMSQTVSSFIKGTASVTADVAAMNVNLDNMYDDLNADLLKNVQDMLKQVR